MAKQKLSRIRGEIRSEDCQSIMLEISPFYEFTSSIRIEIPLRDKKAQKLYNSGKRKYLPKNYGQRLIILCTGNNKDGMEELYNTLKHYFLKDSSRI